MTLALGLIADDGWVLASDTRASRSLPVLGSGVPNVSVATFRSETQKIFWESDAGAIYTYSGTHIGQLTGAAICEQLRQPSDLADKATLFTDIANRIYDAHSTTQVGLDFDPATTLIIVTRPQVEMWGVFARSRTSEATRHLDKLLIGDIHNGAKLFPVLYYSRRPVAELKMLAAHTIVMGHECATSAVGGLEMWTGDSTGNANPIGPEELARLASQSKTIDKGIARRLMVRLSSLQR